MICELFPLSSTSLSFIYFETAFLSDAYDKPICSGENIEYIADSEPNVYISPPFTCHFFFDHHDLACFGWPKFLIIIQKSMTWETGGLLLSEESLVKNDRK